MPAMSKEQSVGFLKSGGMKFDRYETSDVKVRVYDSSATVSGRMARTRAAAGKTASDDWQFTKTYIRRAGKWVVVAFSASPAPAR